MTHRERALKALNHQEPDRVPIDFGGIVDSTIAAIRYQELRRQLNLPPSSTRIADASQYMAILEEDVRQALDIDTAPVFAEPREWRSETFANGFRAELPAKFQPERLPDGSQVVLNGAGQVTLKMPADGFFFDPVYSPLADAADVSEIERHLHAIETYDSPSHLDNGYEAMAAIARRLREQTDYLVVGFFGGHIFQASQSLRGWEAFLIDLLTNRKFAETLMDQLAEANIRRFTRFAETVGPYVDVVHFEDDLGMQDRPLLSPQLYREAVKPYHAKLLRHVKSACDALVLFHSDGAVAHFIPDFIEMGVDAINPVQVSAEGMDTKVLKREFGKEIAFWGAGCDSQRVLPFGTAVDVTQEVKRRIDDLAPGGGFVFAPVHNIQGEVPVENVVTMFETAREYGVY